MKKELIIVNHIGTSVLSTVETELLSLVKDIQKLKPASDVILAFGSDRARRKIASKGMDVLSMEKALDSGVKKGYNLITILPLHVVGGLDYHHLSAVVEVLNQAIHLHKPLLTDEASCESLAIVILETLRPEDRLKPIVVVGHGTEDSSNALYMLLESKLKAHFNQARVITLNTDFNEVMVSLPLGQVIVYPLFTVSGYHLKKDVFEGPDSIANKLSAAGMTVSTYKQGLLAFEPIRQLYLNRLTDKE